MVDEWMEMQFFGLGISQTEAIARLPQLQMSLADAGLREPAATWNDESEQILVRFKSSAEGDCTDDEFDERILGALKAVFPEAFEEPETIEDSVLGTLYWNDDLEKWETEIDVEQHRGIAVSIDPEGEDLEPVFARARAIASDLAQISRDVCRTAATEDLLELYNRSWNHGEPIELDTFCGCLELQSVTVTPKGTEFHYDDGELFLGHLVLVTVDCEGVFQSATLAG
jgi:hypothetical protein